MYVLVFLNLFKQNNTMKTHILFITVALVNAQVLLKGCETKGYVILSAAKSEIHQRIHRPVWKDRTLVSKTTWTGRLECMQYYATVNAGENDSVNGKISQTFCDL